MNEIEAILKGNAKPLSEIREKLMFYIGKALEEDGHCKHYEGSFSIGLPNYFDPNWTLGLDCYVIGPSRHYSWSGGTLAECVSSARKDIDEWCAEFDHWRDYDPVEAF